MGKARSKDDGQEVRRFQGQSAASARVADTLSRGFDLDSATAARAFSAGLLLRVRELLLRELDTLLGTLGTSYARNHVLAIVCRAPEGLQIGEIAARASVHPTTMTSTIDRLRRDGLIKRRTIPTDRRAILVVATLKGQELYEQAREALAGIEFGLADVDSDTINSLLEGLDKVAVALESRDTAAG